MSKQKTIAALRRSAMVSFATHGYEAASLRDICAAAGVPLSAVHTYFGSKSDLYTEVSRLAWEDIERERRAHFSAAAARSPGGASVADFVHAIAYPIVWRALSDDPVDLAWVWIVRGGVWQHGSPSSLQMTGGAPRAIEQWIEELEKRMPGCTHADAVWAYSYIVGTVYSWQIIDRLYDKYLDDEPRPNSAEVAQDIVAFCCAGLDAMVTLRKGRAETAEIPQIRAI